MISRQLDASKIEFPSDRIAWGKIRGRIRDIDLVPNKVSVAGLSDIVALALAERARAQRAFSRALNLPVSDIEKEQDAEFSFIHSEYVRYGISSGPRTTIQLLEKLERDAKDQAISLGISR